MIKVLTVQSSMFLRHFTKQKSSAYQTKENKDSETQHLHT